MKKQINGLKKRLETKVKKLGKLRDEMRAIQEECENYLEEMNGAYDDLEIAIDKLSGVV